jgi:signal transduction histidine kinase/CheY-like chemotaxis protein
MTAVECHLDWTSSYVAIVDDLEINRQFLGNLSKNVPGIAQVKTFWCAKKALENFAVTPPDLIITDFVMPAMDASAFLEALRAMPGLEDTPVIVVSASQEAKNRHKALLCGATDFLTTPFDAVEFQVRVRNLLKLGLHQKFLRAHSLSLRQELAETRLLSWKKSRYQEEKFNNVIDCVPALIFAVGEGSECVFSNKYCSEFFGGHKVEAFNEFISRLMRVHEEQANGAIEIAASDEAGIRSTFLIMRRNVSSIADGKSFTVFSGIDISSLKHTQESLRISKCQAEAANEAKSAFLANISHEIRTPLNAIIGFADIMNTGLLGHIEQESYRDYIKDILHSSQYLLAIINEILDFSQIEQGEQSLCIARFRLSECISSAERMLNSDLRARNNILRVDMKDDHILRTDQQKLTQVLLNIISNANKNSEQGVICISAREAEPSSVIVSIEDQGIGMTEREIDIAMSNFGRVANPQLASINQGIGLGLPISARLMKLLGGELSIWSEKGVGTRVDLRLPASAVNHRDLPDHHSLFELSGP